MDQPSPREANLLDSANNAPPTDSFALAKRIEELTVELAEAKEALQQEIAERNRVQQSLLEFDEKKNVFLATLAHELRNPLAPLSTALHMMALEPHNATQMVQLRDMMSRQVSKLTRLIEDLLDVSRISQGRLNLRREPIALKEVIDAALEIVRPVIENEGHTLSVSVADPTLVVNGDKIRISQIISNLLLNAARYTPRGGRIELTLRSEASQAVLQVRDNGIGIPAHMFEKIFEMFTQVDSSSTRSHAGLGIGLTLVKTLVQKHEGTVEVQSEGEGRGSLFTVRLPALNVSSVAISPPAKAPPASPLVCFRILVVDDNEPAAYLLARLLQKLGQEVLTAHSGPAALEHLSRWQPQIVVSDIAMPGMSGWELATLIRAQNDIVQPYLVALTGYGNENEQTLTRNAGFNKHLIKPVDLRVLENVLLELSSDDTILKQLQP